MFSPSVPDLSKSLKEMNVSKQSIVSEGYDAADRTRNSTHESAHLNVLAASRHPRSSMLRENSGGLSLINLYYDLDGEDEDEEEDTSKGEVFGNRLETGSGAHIGREEADGTDAELSDLSDTANGGNNHVSSRADNGRTQNNAHVVEDINDNNVRNSHLDRYGFMKQNQYISEAEYNGWWAEYSKYCIRRKRKWIELLTKSGLPVDNDSPKRFPSRSEKLKRYVRKGIPAEWRGNAWWYFARGQELLNKNIGVYDKLLYKVNDPNFSSKDIDIIERDLHRTFPDNVHFQKPKGSEEDPQMIHSLRRVLKAFSIYNSKIGYCQSMNFLSGLLLLFMDEERAFWMLVIMTSKYLPGVHSINLEGVNINQGVLLLCIKEYLPHFWQRIYYKDSNKDAKLSNKNEFLYKLPPVTLCTASWFMSCFIGVVPIESTLRIWDCLFYEGSHILFKMSLAIFELSENSLPKVRQSNNRKIDDEDMELFQVIQTFPKKLIDPNEIFDKAIFKRRIRFNDLNQEEIDRCKKYVIAQRLKYKNFHEVINSENGNSNKRDHRLAEDLVNETFTKEGYGFKKGLNGVNWNNNIKEKVRRLSRKK